MRQRFALIGPGRVGQTVARLLVEAGYRPAAIVSRDPERARQAARFAGRLKAAATDLKKVTDAKLILVTVPDDHLRQVAEKLHRLPLKPGTLLVHFSGYHPAAILLPDDPGELRALAIHPLQTFADAVMGVQNLPGSPCSVEGSEDALPQGEKLVRDLGGRPFRLRSEQKTLYHAAACVLSNYLVANTHAACDMLAACGFSRDEAFDLLKPLLTGTLRSLTTLGPDLALTGPIARGDVRTVTAHLDAMRPLPDELQQIYRVLGRKAVQIARQRGSISKKTATQLLKLLDDK
ncbi:putative short-subunit dehydrogenase-like oxidoreductase (DUF2520 family) [Geothermobacter ehrlichii]|uniref:Putative short-subunit dehydrogenase-like oxidoreductase (DUF2520 family) n=1 Tax=Geothermobacter ehrlichii TaxID=213224 RepID=A0A5D3WGG0_9BACT|nr:Rossmann-like and DUF2520 domain-containing protein [Geothermobacter ehrlichii]TYO96389.1 putative short-subunit dehydrogenase-like oxidoreductase (DUF2520 family) [Geothermobacter ehrlichii]